MFLYRMAWAHAVLYKPDPIMCWMCLTKQKHLYTNEKTPIGLLNNWKSIQNGSVVWNITIYNETKYISAEVLLLHVLTIKSSINFWNEKSYIIMQMHWVLMDNR